MPSGVMLMKALGVKTRAVSSGEKNGVRLCSLWLTVRTGGVNCLAWRDRYGWNRNPGSITS